MTDGGGKKSLALETGIYIISMDLQGWVVRVKGDPI